MTNSTEERLESLGIKPLFDGYQPLDLDEVRALENLLGDSLPEEYKTFVDRYGCSYFPGRGVVVRSTQPQKDLGDRLEISAFYGGGREHHRVILTMQLLRGRIAPYMLPIADDHTGNEFCISVAGPSRGNIYFWSSADEPDFEDHTKKSPVPDEMWYRNLTLVADSFVDFISRLESTRGPQ